VVVAVAVVWVRNRRRCPLSSSNKEDGEEEGNDCASS